MKTGSCYQPDWCRPRRQRSNEKRRENVGGGGNDVMPTQINRRGERSSERRPTVFIIIIALNRAIRYSVFIVGVVLLVGLYAVVYCYYERERRHQMT